MPTRLRPFFLFAIALSWLLLLLSALSHAGVGSILGDAWPRWTTLAAQALFVLGVFVYSRLQATALHGQNFLALLRSLVVGPGMLALAGVALYAAEQQVESQIPDHAALIFATIYTINVGLFVVYVARLNYAWRALVLYKSSTGLQRSWLGFELLLGLTLLFLLLDLAVPTGLMYGMLGGLGLFGMYLGANQKWIAYLNPQQKWQAMAYELAILGGLLLFVAFFRHTENDPRRLVPGAQHTFLLLNAFFAAFYAGAGLLVTFFNLPTAGIFEQRRSEILSLQRLTQVIQRGKTPADIYQALLDSSVQTTHADAAWLDVHPIAGSLTGTPVPDCLYLIPIEQAYELRAYLKEQGLCMPPEI